MVNERREYVRKNMYQHLKIDKFDILMLRRILKDKSSGNATCIVYGIKSKWKRFFSDRIYMNLRNPWNYSWVKDIHLLTMVELRIHCMNNKLSPSGDKQLLIQRLLSI